MKTNNTTIKMLKIIIILILVISSIFLILYFCGYKPTIVIEDALIGDFKAGDLILIKEDEVRLTDIYLTDSRKLPVDCVIRFPLLGYLKEFIESKVGIAAIAFSTIFIIITIF